MMHEGRLQFRKAILAGVVFALAMFAASGPVLGQSEARLDQKAGFEKPLNMSLGDCVALAVRQNVSIEIAYINRVLQKYNLKTDTSFRYVPMVSIDGTAKTSETLSNKQNVRDDELSASATIVQKVPTGGNFQFDLSTSQEKDSESGSSTFKETTSTSSWTVTFTQPLMKSAWSDYDLSYVRQAEVEEKGNIVNLKSTVIDTVTEAISYYRSLLEAKHSVQISKESLDIAQKSLDNARVEVEYGRLAAMDLIQYESSVADSELSLERARNNYINARLDLAKHLNLDKKTLIVPSEDINVADRKLDEQKSLELAYANRPEYLNKKLSLEGYEYELLRATRDVLPELGLTASFGETETSSTSTEKTRNDKWSVGLELSTPLFGADRRALTSAEISAKSQVRIAQIELKKTEEDIASDVADSIRDIKVKAKSVKLAVRARELAEKKLAVEEEKRKVGRSSAFQIVTFQNDLSSAKDSELTAKIDYLNALNTFDQYLGTTLGTWKIDFKTERKEAEEGLEKVK